MNTELNIAYSITTRTFDNIFISLLSILNTTNSRINFYLFENELPNEKKELLLSLNKNYQDKCLINIVHVEEYYCNALTDLGLLDISAWFRILAPTLCPNINKLIYITSVPTIITTDLSELYNINIEDKCIGVVADIIDSANLAAKYNLSSLSFSNMDVILMNCEKIRNFNLFNKLKNAIKNNTTDILNIIIAFNVLFDSQKIEIHPKFNYQEYWYSNIYDREISKSKEYAEAKIAPVIINYRGVSPQYSSCHHSFKDQWWDYAQKNPFRINKIQSYKLSATSAQNSFKYTWLLSRIWPYIKPYMFRIILGFLIAIPLGLLDGVTAFALKPYMDYVIGGKSFDLTWHNYEFTISSIQMAYIIPVGVILFAILQGVLRYLNGYISTWTSQRITNDVKFDLFDRLINMHSQFFDDNSSGIIISRYLTDPKTASAGIVENIKTITTSFCGAMGLIGVMLYSSWKLALIGVLVLCIAFIPVLLIRKRIKEASNKNMVIGGNITTNINETYSGNKVMTAYDLQNRQNKYFREQTWKSFNINMSLYKRAGWMSPMMYLIASFGIATVLGYGTFLINSGQMTAGAFASFVTSLLLLYKPVKTLGNTLTGIQNIFVAMGRVFELFDLTPAIKDCQNPKELNGLKNGIKFENVQFEYVPNKLVLKNLNLDVKKNETIAIVGNSGGGKSTLVNLIPRFYDIKSGSIKIDDVDIREFSLKSLHKNIAIVFQENFLYSGTVKENIMMGEPNASIEELMCALKSAHLQDMIQELPDGLNTVLGERGLTLSGGQRQRVAIARAMLRNAPIVILDEATSALDNESEAIVQKAMDNLMKDRTVFIIAHRLSTIKNADRIAVINEGELVELGTHEELMNIENGQYKALYEMQFKKQEVNV